MRAREVGLVDHAVGGPAMGQNDAVAEVWTKIAGGDHDLVVAAVTHFPSA